MGFVVGMKTFTPVMSFMCGQSFMWPLRTLRRRYMYYCVKNERSMLSMLNGELLNAFGSMFSILGPSLDPFRLDR